MATLAARLRSHARVPLFRNAYALMLSGGASSGLGVLYWILASREYSPKVIGTSSTAIATLMFLTGLASLYLDGSLIRFLPRAGAGTARLVLVAYATSMLMAVVVTLVFVLGTGVWAPDLAFFGSSGWWIVAAVGATVASCIFTLQDGVLIGLRRAVWVPVENIGYGVAKIVLLVVIAGATAANGILISWVAPLLLVIPAVSLLLVRLIRQRGVHTADHAESLSFNRVASYAAGNYFGFLFFLAYTRLPPLLVLNESGSAASGFFYLPWMIASTLTLLVGNMSVSLIVEVTLDRDNTALHIRRAGLHLLRLLGPVVAVLFVSAPLVLRVFGQQYADEGTRLLRLFAIAAVPNAMCVLAFGVARLQDRVRLIVTAQFILMVLTLGSSSLLLPDLGIEGFGVGWLASQVVVATGLWLLILRPAWKPRITADA